MPWLEQIVCRECGRSQHARWSQRAGGRRSRLKCGTSRCLEQARYFRGICRLQNNGSREPYDAARVSEEGICCYSVLAGWQQWQDYF